jgi:hypothetical protein
VFWIQLFFPRSRNSYSLANMFSQYQHTNNRIYLRSCFIYLTSHLLAGISWHLGVKQFEMLQTVQMLVIDENLVR